ATTRWSCFRPPTWHDAPSLQSYKVNAAAQRFGIHQRVAQRKDLSGCQAKKRSGEAASRRVFSGIKHIRPHAWCNALLERSKLSCRGLEILADDAWVL